ncbi:hypothetical protein BBJ28_00008418 [Nothophytophthora sp. Chile5]|nr:hypothetical protein BBJ28_00008418 [Nothophytophthora sp. Chile5]
MEEDDASAILQRVEKATEIFTRHVATNTGSSHSRTPHAQECSFISDDISALKRIMEELQRFVASFESRRVLTLSGSRLMEAGVDLYNAPRPAFKELEEVEKLKQQAAEPPRSFPRYLLAVTRFTAAKVMGLALIFSKGSGRQEGGVKRGSHYMDECVNVLRSFGRVGMLMLESASVDCDKCQEYLAFAKESFSCSLQLWARIGLSHLTKFKQDLELEEVVDDLWDFCMDRVRVLQLLTEGGGDSMDETQEIVTSLHELKMLVPYKSSYAVALLDLMRGVSDRYDHMGQHEQQIAFVEEAMRVCDSLEINGEEELAELVTSFKQNTLVNFLRSLCATGDVDRAETCYQLIPANRDPKVLLLMVKLHVENKLFDKAHHLLRLLFQQDSLDESILGARIYAQGLSFSEEGMDMYGELLRNYGDSMFEISVELACVLACVESKCHQAMVELKRLGGDIHEMERYVQREADALAYERCLFTCVIFRRIMSHSNLKLGRAADASIWAEKAFASETSKNSLFTLFQVALESKEGKQSAARILDRLKARDDFGIQDLLAFGKLASNAGPEKQDVVLHILDELCDMLIRDEECPASLPKGIVLQNAAQLAFTKFTQRSFVPKEEPESSYGEKFLTYARALMQLSKLDTAYESDTFAPPSVFEWFYGMW